MSPFYKAQNTNQGIFGGREHRKKFRNLNCYAEAKTANSNFLDGLVGGHNSGIGYT